MDIGTETLWFGIGFISCFVFCLYMYIKKIKPMADRLFALEENELANSFTLKADIKSNHDVRMSYNDGFIRGCAESAGLTIEYRKSIKSPEDYAIITKLITEIMAQQIEADMDMSKDELN